MTDNILTRGSEVLSANPNFKLVGRDKELNEISTVLMQMTKNNVIITGRPGVGISSIVLGIQASKENPTTPVEIVGKRFWWFNTDNLFASGNTQAINQLFDKARASLTKNCVIVLEDTIDFIRACQNNSCNNLLNGLMGDLKSKKYQAIFETKDDEIGEILKADGDLREFCTLIDVGEPSPAALRTILTEVANNLTNHYTIKIDPKAIESACSLTEKFQLKELRAQPDAAISLLDRTMAETSKKAHICPEHMDKDRWESKQQDLRKMYSQIRDGEDSIRVREEELQKFYKENSSLEVREINLASNAPEAEEIKKKLRLLNEIVTNSKNSYRDLIADIYQNLLVTDAAVLTSFSDLSGIPVDKLSEDERARLKNLDKILSERVIGQLEPTTEVAKAVRRARVGLKMPNKPAGTFMFLGPSGVGKTELAKALAESLQVNLLRFDMSEYGEKHAVAKLIGAPPGYEGYEAGGVLTNAVRRNPYSVILFDEIEKAHVDIFNVMLQVLDDARLTDSRGLTASFKDAIIIMTTNIGTPHFLDEELPFEDAKLKALTDLREQYRPEFLGRFGGNIYCFQRLSMDVLAAIFLKDISRVNKLIADKEIELQIRDEEVDKILKDKYVAREGARSILGYIDRNITSGIADVILGDTPRKGELWIDYDNGAIQLI